MGNWYKPARLVGYMVRQEDPPPGVFILSPPPVSLGHEDEALADDLPASVIFVHADALGAAVVPYIPGLLQLTGLLSVGQWEEADDRLEQARTTLDRLAACAWLEDAVGEPAGAGWRKLKATIAAQLS